MKRFGLALSLLFAALSLPAEQPKWGLSLTPYYADFPGAELGLERLYSRHNALKLITDYRPHAYDARYRVQRLGGGLGHRSYWFGREPMSGLFLELKLLAYHVDDILFDGSPFQYSLVGGGLEHGWMFLLPWPAWRLGVLAELRWLIGDQRNYSQRGLPYEASDPNGRISIDAWVSLAYTY